MRLKSMMLFSSSATTAVLRSFLVKICCWIPWYRRSHQGVACCREELPVTCGNSSCWIVLHLLGDITTIAIHILANKIAHAKSSSKEQNSKREPWRQGEADIFSTIQQLMPGLLPSKSGSDSQSKQNRNTKRASAKNTDVKKSNRTEKVTAS